LNNYYRITFFNTKYSFSSFELVEAETEQEAREKYNLYNKKDDTAIIGISKCWVDPETGAIVG
jgi:hypothetical protein